MNLNQSIINKKRPKNVGNEAGIPTFKTKQVMGPPLTPAPKRKSVSTPSSATNWGRSQQNIFNNSVMRSGSSTLTTSENESRSIIALTEGRGDARCEVGMAAIDLSLPTLILCQISDAQSYINTLTKINILNPTDIVVPSTILADPNNRLVDKIRKQFPKIKIVGAPRKTFNKSCGMDRILQLCLPSINSICVGLQHKYYALAAAAALLVYLRNNLYVFYANESINVVYQESEGYAVIDVSTADRLELVSCTKPAQASRFSTLFGVLNYCDTKLGARLLRSTILQPPCDPSIIENTSHCVAELIKHPHTIASIKAILTKVSNVDQLLSITTFTSGGMDSWSARGLNYLLLLNGLIDLVEPLKDIIENFQQPFFNELKNTLSSDKFNLISNEVRNLLHPSAKFAKNEAAMTQRCFAIKSGINGLLDLVRKTYSERLNDMTEYVNHLGNKYKLPLTLANNNTKGYHIVLRLNNQQKRLFKKSDLPPEFIQVYRLAGSCTMKTQALINYSTRLDDIMIEILKISNTMINQTVCNMKQHIGFFYKLCEDIARLDMLQSLAEASKRGNYIRPKFGEYTELTQARHPILEKLIGDQRIPNPISISQDYNVHIITGPNGSGKSIYIRQVLLLQVMAQIGCYVPADTAIFRPMSRMFARIYLEDNMEYGASAFMLEMKEVKYMMSLLSENSLFVIDELCRSTAADEGTALAMAICEKFCSTSVFLYVTTHYTPITDLSHLYVNVKTWQMETISTGDTPQDLSLDFRYRLIPGVTTLKHYGVYIVKNIWSESILEEVYKILESQKSTAMVRKFEGVDERIRLKYKLESDFRKLKSRRKLSSAQINKLLNDYQNELQKFDIFLDLTTDANFIVPPSSDHHLESVDGDHAMDDELIPHHDEAMRICIDLDQDDPFETSSYRNLSNFLKEDSDNINKLIPEVTIACNENNPIRIEYSQSLTEDDFEEVENFLTPICNAQSSTVWRPNIYNNETTPSCSQANNEELFMEVEEMSATNVEATEQHKIQSVSTPTAWGGAGANNNIDDDSYVQSIIEDLESCKDSFFSDEFDFSQTSEPYHSAIDEVEKSTKPQHIFPVVNIIRGPSWISDVSPQKTPNIEKPVYNDMLEEGQNMHQNFQLSESISYSPLQSPVSNNNNFTSKTSDPADCDNTSSSPLYFMVRSDKDNRGNDATTTDTNLENISMNRAVDNITFENYKSTSSSVEKPSSKSTSTSVEKLSNKSESENISKTTSSTKESKSSSEDRVKSRNKKKLGLKRSNSTGRKPVGLPSKRFVPPRKLTKREIEEEFREQDRQLYEAAASAANSDCSKYLSRLLNRPTVKQVQNSKHLAFARRTDAGVEVIPAPPEPLKKSKKFQRTISNNSRVDMSIFSDKNAKRFDEFLNSNERDVKRFKFNFDNNNQSPARSKQDFQFHFQPQTVSDYATGGNEQLQFCFKSHNPPLSQSFSNFQSLTPVTPDGYYKQNKEDINKIMDKYMHDGQQSQDIFGRGLPNETDLFESHSINGLDLDL